MTYSSADGIVEYYLKMMVVKSKNSKLCRLHLLWSTVRNENIPLRWFNLEHTISRMHLTMLSLRRKLKCDYNRLTNIHSKVKLLFLKVNYE